MNVYICMYVYVYKVLEKKTTHKLQVPPDKPVSWVTHSLGDLICVCMYVCIYIIYIPSLTSGSERSTPRWFYSTHSFIYLYSLRLPLKNRRAVFEDRLKILHFYDILHFYILHCHSEFRAEAQLMCIYIYIYITNCRQNCFGLLGLISAVLMLGWR